MFLYKVNKQEKASDQDVTIIITRFTTDHYLQLQDTIITGNPFQCQHQFKITQDFSISGLSLCKFKMTS